MKMYEDPLVRLRAGWGLAMPRVLVARTII